MLLKTQLEKSVNLESALCAADPFPQQHARILSYILAGAMVTVFLEEDDLQDKLAM